MSTFKELVYMVLDQVKTNSDDSYFEEEHVRFLLDKYRSFILKQRYSDLRKQVPESNYQNIFLDLVEVPAIAGVPCEGGSYLRSKEKIPYVMNLGITRIYPTDYFKGEIAFISRDRLRYVNYSSIKTSTIYVAFGPDGYLYFNSTNPQFLHLEKVRMCAIFSSATEAFSLQDPSLTCDLSESLFPIEDALIPPIVELCVKDILGASYRPEDNENNAQDDLSNLATFLRLNVKSGLAKQIEQS